MATMTARLPNLLIAGVPRGGTSSLFAYLGQHPDVCAATTKEVRFFTPLMDPAGALPSMESYGRYFAHCEGQRYALEATPSYCYGGSRVLSAIDETLPDPRIIITLRDPVERLISAYRFQRARDNIPTIRSFEEYVAACQEEHERAGDAISGGHLKGLSIGFYAAFVPHWFEHFDGRVRFVFSEHLYSDPHAVVTSLCHWLEIDSLTAGSFDYAVRNPTVNPRSSSLARMVFAAKRKLDEVLPRGTPLRKSLRRTYVRVNSGRPEEQIDPRTRLRVSDVYRDSNRLVADALRERGYGVFPAWLSDDEGGTDTFEGPASPVN